MLETTALSLALGPKSSLENITLKFRAGDLHLITGANGCGKSTLLLALAGLKKPHSGNVLLSGEPILKHRRRARKEIGFLFQSSEAQIVCHTARAELAFGPQNLGFPRAKIEENIELVAKELGLSPLLGRKTEELSGGEKRLLCLGALLTCQPSALLLDEPFTGLDLTSASALLKALESFLKRGGTAVLTTHDLEKCVSLATTLTILQEGKVAYNGEVQNGLPLLQNAGVRPPGELLTLKAAL